MKFDLNLFQAVNAHKAALRIPGFRGAKQMRVIANPYTTQNRKFTGILHCNKTLSTSGDNVKNSARVVTSTSEWKKMYTFPSP